MLSSMVMPGCSNSVQTLMDVARTAVKEGGVTSTPFPQRLQCL